MKFKITIDIPEETLLIYQEWLNKEEKKLDINLFDIKQLQEFIGDMIQEQTQWEVLNCKLIDKIDLKEINKIFNQK